MSEMRNHKYKCKTNYFRLLHLSVWCLNHVGPTLTGCCHWSWYKTLWDFNRHNPPDDLSSLEPCPISTPPKPPTAELWCMAHYLFFCLFIPLIQAVTLAADNTWVKISVISPSTGTLLLKSHAARGCLNITQRRVKTGVEQLKPSHEPFQMVPLQKMNTNTHTLFIIAAVQKDQAGERERI